MPRDAAHIPIDRPWEGSCDILVSFSHGRQTSYAPPSFPPCRRDTRTAYSRTEHLGTWPTPDRMMSTEWAFMYRTPFIEVGLWGLLTFFRSWIESASRPSMYFLPTFFVKVLANSVSRDFVGFWGLFASFRFALSNGFSPLVFAEGWPSMAAFISRLSIWVGGPLGDGFPLGLAADVVLVLPASSCFFRPAFPSWMARGPDIGSVEPPSGTGWGWGPVEQDDGAALVSEYVTERC